MDDERKKPLLKDLRVCGLIAGGVLFGFVVALLIFGSPWHLPPNWGDIPTWLLVALAGAAGWVGFAQLSDLRQQITDDARRNVKRDQLMDKQLDEAERREEADLRRLVEDVTLLSTGGAGDVVNKSKRPLFDITCKVMSKVDRHTLATPAESGEMTVFSDNTVFLTSTKPVSRIETLRAPGRCSFIFKDLKPEHDHVTVAWFTDDAGFRWQLDEYQHLVRSDDESEYLPSTPRPSTA